MTLLSPLADYFLAAAQRSARSGITEREFIDNLDLDTLAQSPARQESYGLAMSEAMSSNEWPWDTGKPIQ